MDADLSTAATRTATDAPRTSPGGFSASSLRYYEGIGLVEPTNRTAAGYRLYDDHSINRLAFIARAKQLGCSLEEIVDLADVWDGERCGPVQRRFHELVTAKIHETERQIDELTGLLADLRVAARHLDAEPVDGPCDADCACLTMVSIPQAVEFTAGRGS